MSRGGMFELQMRRPERKNKLRSHGSLSPGTSCLWWVGLSHQACVPGPCELFLQNTRALCHVDMTHVNSTHKELTHMPNWYLIGVIHNE